MLVRKSAFNPKTPRAVKKIKKNKQQADEGAAVLPYPSLSLSPSFSLACYFLPSPFSRCDLVACVTERKLSSFPPPPTLLL